MNTACFTRGQNIHAKRYARLHTGILTFSPFLCASIIHSFTPPPHWYFVSTFSFYLFVLPLFIVLLTFEFSDLFFVLIRFFLKFIALSSHLYSSIRFLIHVHLSTYLFFFSVYDFLLLSFSLPLPHFPHLHFPSCSPSLLPLPPLLFSPPPALPLPSCFLSLLLSRPPALTPPHYLPRLTIARTHKPHLNT